jgi:hypothetical protein
MPVAQAETPTILKITETARLLNVPKNALVAAINTNRVKSMRIGHDWYVRVDEARAFFAPLLSH